MTESGVLLEVFASIQGEGIYCGQRQTFVRFAGCNLSCDYCDTPAAREFAPRFCRVERAPGTGSFSEIPNPVSARETLDICRGLSSTAVSLTGGEPLCQPDFLELLMQLLKNDGFRIHLETNGTLWYELHRVVSLVDVVAMDIKIPSASGQPDLWGEHAKFLDIATKTEVFVKAVVCGETSDTEIRRCAEMIAERDRAIPLIIQPATISAGVSGFHLMKLQETALGVLDDVRVIPQCHRILGLR